MTGAIVAAVLVAVLFLTVAFFALLLNVMRRTVRRNTEEAVAPLRQKVFSLLERGEALKARQAKLIGTGGSGVSPPAGETARVAEAAARQIQEFYERWTELQQKLDRVRELVASESKWGRAHLDDARDLALEKETSSARAAAAGDEAEKLLDQIEAAPERAVAAIDRARAGLKAAQEKTGAAERSGGPAAASRATIEDLEARAATLDAMLRPDPLGAANAAEALAREVDGLLAEAPGPTQA